MIGSEIQANLAAFSCSAGARGNAFSIGTFISIFAHKRVIVFSATAAVIAIGIRLDFASIGDIAIAVGIVGLALK